MKRLLRSLIILTTCYTVGAQELPKELKRITINRKVSEFSERLELSSPEEAYVSMWLTYSKGEDKPSIYSADNPNSALYPGEIAEKMSEKYRDAVFNSIITDVYVYCDSVAYVLRDEGNTIYYGVVHMENGKWKHAGEGIFFDKSPEAMIKEMVQGGESSLMTIRQIEKEQVVMASVDDCLRYLADNAQNPDEYLLDKLQKYPVVVYGEQHRRQWSWELMSYLVKNPEFPKLCGTVYFEQPTHMQSVIDEFYAAKEMNPELVLDVLRQEQVYGWQDRGMYELFITIWEVNSKLPESQKIKALLADRQTPWYEVDTAEEFNRYTDSLYVIDRDTHMANVVEDGYKNRSDNRSQIFIVGYGHAHKTTPLENIERGRKSAGTHLKERLSAEKVFIVTQHTAVGDNHGRFYGLSRYGLFDEAFRRYGDVPIAFDLLNSPFGNEYYDVQQELRFAMDCGSYSDYYDGLIFLGPLENEPYDYLLYELFDDDFIAEMKRR